MSDEPASGGPDRVHVVGIGADGWEGLSPAARRTVEAAEVLMGSHRQLALIPETTGERVPWPSPLLPALPGLLAEHAGRSTCVLASGDPMFHGIGATLAGLLGPQRLEVFPQPSSVSLACARLGWPSQDARVVNLVGRPVENLLRGLAPGERVLVLSSDGSTPAAVAELLTAHGFGPSELAVLENLGGRDERILRDTAAQLRTSTAALNIVAVECASDRGTGRLPSTPGLTEELFEHDGQLTKRDVRASTLARLAPRPGELLWDVGAGSGSIAIEWMRSAASCRAIAVERNPERAARTANNAAALGAGSLRIVREAAPEGLRGLERPDAVFVGGGVSVPGVLDSCVEALPRGGRLVVNAVTMESESTVIEWYSRMGGELVRIGIEQAGPVGGFTAWRPAMRVTQWAVTKP
ncbi:precorrin-6y C5,15-methyltransferase (decarboxylating) subunit CbiE [Actinopolyspora saharensis]|uniref:Precorrin-6Y C5,15-methyltransferase (Decarboxylating) n=1 Tax=Actinopolyspora saharensis TaxID=995062 RepID=A0A1H1AXI0_9ACTN|nr:precorrin-6y C5,15-methyltransferase (decarboxylating) subunit CbiE [Actinopolyspora saharensis]SDQ44353.1 precorrin-6Y C5,15-methyltransferase (decarboxylating) [Actinopolyspora saharensis]